MAASSSCSCLPPVSQRASNAGTIFSFKKMEVKKSTGRPGRHWDDEDSPRHAKVPDVEISCFSPFRGLKPIKELLSHIHQLNVVEHEKTTDIFRPEAEGDYRPQWDGGISRPARTLESVVMDERLKAEVIQDIISYLSNESRDWLVARGIPWRRGYLFYGPPGKGKTSFCTALAGHLECPIYVLSLSDQDMYDKTLGGLFAELPERCIILREDIDSAGIRREFMAKPGRYETGWKRNRTGGGGVTLTGLLNVIHGPVAQEGRVLLLTSNTPDNLDTALVRPDRIDKKVLFGNASREVIAALYMRSYDDADQSRLDELEDLSLDFADKVPANRLTPAEIQGFLLLHRDDAYAAVDLAGDWVRGVIASKDAGKDVEGFRDQIGNDGFGENENVTTDGRGWGMLAAAQGGDAGVGAVTNEWTEATTKATKEASGSPTGIDARFMQAVVAAYTLLLMMRS